MGPQYIQWFFAVVSILGFVFALFILPETHGKKLSDIEDYFSGAAKEKERAKKTRNGTGAAASTVNNRKPKQTLETVNEAEKMIKENV